MKCIGLSLTILGGFALAASVYTTIRYYAGLGDESQRRAPIAIVATAFVAVSGSIIIYLSSRRNSSG